MTFQMDGDKWMCTPPDFVDLQQSCAGFGDTQSAAVADMVKNLDLERLRFKTALEAIVTRKASDAESIARRALGMAPVIGTP
jgi:hypothetical protein